MNRRSGSSNGDDFVDQVENLNIAPERQIPYPSHVGYYLQKELEEDPGYVDIKLYQLDRELIKEINNQEGYRFTGNVVDYHQENGYHDIFRNTVVLEKYIKLVRPRKDKKKLRIFVRGGSLCDFLMGTGITPVSTLEFDYDEEENILRLQKPRVTWDIRSFDFSKVGEHRLTGDKSETVVTGKESSYKVMELKADDYDLYYSKEVDGFDGDEPIEIRGVFKSLGLKGLKIYYRSIALADIVKVVVMVSEGEGDDRIRKVSIVDDFSRHDTYGAKEILFKELDKIFSRFIPIFKRVKKGQITKAIGGMVLIPEATEPASPYQGATVLYQAGFSFDLWRIFGLHGDVLESRLISAVSNRKRLYLCLQNPETFLEIVDIRIREMVMGQIAACFFEYHKDPTHPWKELNKEGPYLPVRDYWRQVVQSRNPELLLPLPLKRQDVCTFSPFIYLFPYIDGYIPYNNTPWIFSAGHNVLVAPLRYDIQRLLSTLSTPLPELPRRVRMTVYTQEPCEDLLQNFFQDRITFTEPPPDAPIIFCTIYQIPPEENFRATVFGAMHVADVDQRQVPQTAGLYLINRENVLPLPCWDNKVDLQLLEKFDVFDKIRSSVTSRKSRKFPIIRLSYMDEVQLQLNKFLYDQKYFSARTLNRLSAYFAIREDILFKVLAGLFVLLLIVWQHAAFLANSVLLGYPLLLMVFHKKEVPAQKQMLLYWPLLASFIALDRYLDNLPFFHVIKMAVLVGIFLYPSGVTTIRRLTRENLRLCLREWALKPEELKILEKKKERHNDRRSQLITEASPAGSENYWLTESWKSGLKTEYSNMTEMTLETEESTRVTRRTEEESAVSTTATSIKSTFI